MESPDFDILLLEYSIDGSEVHVVDLVQGDTIPTAVIDALTDEHVCKWAFNAQFERVCLSRWLPTASRCAISAMPRPMILA